MFITVFKNRQTDRQTDRPTDGQTNRQTDGFASRDWASNAEREYIYYVGSATPPCAFYLSTKLIYLFIDNF